MDNNEEQPTIVERASPNRYKNSDDRERERDHRRDQLHAEDPMAEYIRQEEEEQRKLQTGDSTEAIPVYKGKFPSNRYNIKPGYRWDGVDRSNGHEKRLFEKQSGREADEEEAYRWRTEDL